MPRCFMGMISDSKVSVAVPKENLVLRYEQARNMCSPNTSIILYTENLSDFPSSDMGTTHDATANCSSMGASDASITPSPMLV